MRDIYRDKVIIICKHFYPLSVQQIGARVAYAFTMKQLRDWYEFDSMTTSINIFEKKCTISWWNDKCMHNDPF